MESDHKPQILMSCPVCGGSDGTETQNDITFGHCKEHGTRWALGTNLAQRMLLEHELAKSEGRDLDPIDIMLSYINHH